MLHQFSKRRRKQWLKTMSELDNRSAGKNSKKVYIMDKKLSKTEPRWYWRLRVKLIQNASAPENLRWQYYFVKKRR